MSDEVLELIERVYRENWTELNLLGRNLKELPPAVGKLKNLQKLWLDRNQLTRLPTEIGNLCNLKELYLSNNQLISLPPEIGKMQNLKNLDLSNNQLTSLPSEIGKMGNLQVLWLTGNQLTNLPSAIGNLENLHKFSLSYNQLSNLPPEIGNLENLQNFYLSNAQLPFLPPEIGNMENLERLDLRGNPLDIKIPPEIINKTELPQTILNYYFEHKNAPTRSLNEAKLILLGQGGVGKTSLVNRLLYNTFNPDENKTPGVAINKWNIDIGDDDIQLNIWDFGGQVIYHTTHQFFMTKRTIYIIVLNSRQGKHEIELEYWLKLIKSYGDDSPVIVACNKSEQHKIDLNWTGLKNKHPQIKGFIKEMSCKNGEGIEEAKLLIKIATGELEHIHDQLHKTWFEVKEELEDMRKNFEKDFIPCSDYHRLCEDRNINNKTSQKTLLGFLHDLGIVLCYQDDPRLEYMYVLNPLWVTEGVYQIMNSHELFHSKGVLTIESLHEILNKLNKPGEERYPADKHLFIIDMMRKFELCFDFEGTKDTKFLVPDLLPKDEPYTGEWNDSLEFQYHYDVLPGSVISRFIVRMHQFVHQNTYWRTGVVLIDRENKALVRADLVDGKIFICVNGTSNSRRDFLSKIRGQFEAIHSTITGIKAEVKVPIPGHPEAPPVDYEELIGLLEMDEEYYKDGKFRIKVSIREMLNGIETAEYRERKRHGDNVYHIYKGAEFTMGDNIKNSIIQTNNTGNTSAGDQKVGRSEAYKESTVQRDNSGQTMAGNNNIMTQSQRNEAVKHIKELKDAIQEIDKEELPEEKKTWTLKQLDRAMAEAEKKQPDKDFIINDLKGAVETVKNAGLLASTSAGLAKMLVPLTNLLGLGAGYFGL